MAKYYDYKPIPRFKKGDMVYRTHFGVWMTKPEPISRVVVKHYKFNDKWGIEYYFPRERTPYGEEELRTTLEEQLRAEAEDVIKTAFGRLSWIHGVAEKHQINLGASAALLEQYKSKKI